VVVNSIRRKGQILVAVVIDKEAIKRGQNIIEEFEKRIKKTGEKFPEHIGFLQHYSFSKEELTRIQRFFESGELKKLSDVFTKTEYKVMLGSVIDDRYKKQFLYIVDKLIEFPYTQGWSRRTLRSADCTTHLYAHFERCLMNFITIGIYSTDICSILKNNYNEDFRAYRINNKYQYNYNVSEFIIAAELDLGNIELEQLLTDIFMSENNTFSVSVEMIRGIVMSDNKKLHKLLGDYLLAAKLQGGVRQAVCENMDCGTVEAFLLLLDVINQNNLIRFSSVKRAICTWTGICPTDYKDIDRIPQKTLSLISECLNDEQKREEYTYSNDAIELYISLWAYGFYCVEDTRNLYNRLFSDNNRHRLLVASTYLSIMANSNQSILIAEKVLEEHYDDVELCACYLPYICGDATGYLSEHTGVNRKYTKNPKLKTANSKLIPILSDSNMVIFEKRYDLMKKLYETHTQKSYKFEPFIFPWNSATLDRSNFAELITFYAYCLDDTERLEYAADTIPDINTWKRNIIVHALLAKPRTEKLKRTLYLTIGDKSDNGRRAAFDIADELPLYTELVPLLEDLTRSKNNEIRNFAAKMLLKQDNTGVFNSIERFVVSKKEEQRMTGLDLIMRSKSMKENKELYKSIRPLALKITDPSEKEKIIINELSDNSEADKVLNVKGYGLYNPDAADYIPKYKADYLVLKRIFSKSNAKKLEEIKNKLDQLITDNGDCEYRARNGEIVLLKNSFEQLSERNNGGLFNNYPFPELWIGFYETEIKDFDTLMRLKIYLNTDIGMYHSDEGKFDTAIKKIYGKKYIVSPSGKFLNTISTVINLLIGHFSVENQKDLRTLSISVLDSLINLPTNEGFYIKKSNSYESLRRIETNSYFSNFVDIALRAKNDEEYIESFALRVAKEYKRVRELPVVDHAGKFERGNSAKVHCQGIDLIKAYSIGIITKDQLYKLAFGHSIEEFTRDISWVACKIKKHRYYRSWSNIYNVTDDDLVENSRFRTAFEEIYFELSEIILKVELNRSDVATPFSSAAKTLAYIDGMEHFVDILTALGNDPLSKSIYYYSYDNNNSKSHVLSSLLLSCKPKENDNAKTLKAAIKGRKITEKRLIEVAMFNTDWVDIIQEYLGWNGLESGIYYFAAHLNERFDDVKKALIAKHTPLTPEELYAGSFDIKWFNECYAQLGEKRFQILYDSAKYIANGNKHTRARKYADAVLGKVSAEDLEKQILDKRNKDLLMSYPLIPLADSSEVLRRYKFIQKYLKESKKFGAQRRVSEAAAANSALINLASNTGFGVVTRLILNMETKMGEEFARFFRFYDVEDVSVKIQIKESGKSEIICKKNEKLLKSIPAKLNNNEYIIEIKEVCKQFRDQYSRTKLMLEQFMEDGTEFTVLELNSLHNNPVTSSLIRELVFICDEKEKIGFVKCLEITNADGNTSALEESDMLRPAHTFDLYKSGQWHKFQKSLFDNQIKQPFKQVFRELYVKTEDELEALNSRRYSGNQIQPKKAAACLKSRCWIADVEDGLQKIYYKENIIARIYAIADWFSPADMECPAIEWVEFSNRKTGEAIKICEIPNIIFSEVMRDVDLAVSVAHVGGVDPETSHSTVEMRRAVIEFNLPLFGLKNVTFTDNHAHIKGSRADYTVHLGSGVIFVEGGTQIAVLPVHSQQRGKLFLPFIDEDPKTAEIMSKVVLFAEDKKIKDPYILKQI